MSKRDAKAVAKAALKPKVPATEQAQLDLAGLKAKYTEADLKARYKTLVERLALTERQLEFATGLRDCIPTIPREPIRVVSSGKASEATAVLVSSDWHAEETVDPATVEGVNRYNLKIAEARITKFFQNGLKLVEMVRSKSNVKTLVLSLLGDLIAGFIHEELVESNQCSPTHACRLVFKLAREGIDLILEHGEFDQVIIVCNCGNHGRTTQKPRISTSAANSYEWLVYQFLSDVYAGNPKVTFQIAEGYFNYLDVYGFTYRFHHGDGIRYQGGVGDVDVPLNKAIAQWNKFKRADVDVLGHWHTRKMSRNFVLNGSIVGFNAFCIRIKGSYEPPQQSFFLVDPRHGKTVEAPVWVE